MSAWQKYQDFPEGCMSLICLDLSMILIESVAKPYAFLFLKPGIYTGFVQPL